MSLKVALIPLLLLLSRASGQGPVGTINGTVTDPDSAVVPAAAVVATNNATLVEYRAATTSTGAYTIPYVPAGTYTVHISAPGFRKTAAENIILRVAQTVTLDLQLQIGSVNDQVTVIDRPELVEGNSGEMGLYVTQEEYKSWPILLNGGHRQIQQFIFDSLPGTTGSTWQGSINGGQLFSHDILIDGITVGRSDLLGGSTEEMSPSAEAIAEFKLQTGALGADFNGGQTAVANYTIKSGANDPHGSLFYYVHNEALNSQDIQSKTAGEDSPRNRLNNYGYSFGGPIYIPKIYKGRNKTFFFTNFEHTRQDNLLFSGFTTVPPAAFRRGDFSGLLNPAFTGNPLSGTQIGSDALGRPIVYGQIYNPKTSRTLPDGAVVRDPFPNNQIPELAWDPVATNILTKFGYPSPTSSSMVRNIPELGTCCPYFSEHIIGIKIDHQLNEKNHLSAYYNGGWRDRNNNSGPGYLPIAASPSNTWTEQSTPSIMGRLSLVSILSASISNRLAAGYNRFVNLNGTPAPFLHKDYASTLGLQNLPGTIFPTVSFSGAEWQGGSIVGMGAGYSDRSVNGSYIFQDDLTWIHGAHTLRIGYEYRRYLFNDRPLSDAGSFSFSPLQTGSPASSAAANVDVNNGTGNAFASFLLGAAQSASHNIVGMSSGFRQPQHGAYVMDTWKITPRLTLNLGFRWEIIPPLFEVTNRMSEIDLNAPNPGAGNRPGSLVFARHVNDTYWKGVFPRLGVSYRVSERIVVRGGYAILGTPPISNGWGYSGFLYGYNGTVSVPAKGAINDAALYLSDPFPTLNSSLPNTDPALANFASRTVAGTLSPPATTARDANRPGYTQNYNFTIQFRLPAQTVVSATYLGNKGTRMWGGIAFNEINTLPASLLSLGSILNEPLHDHLHYLPYPGFPATNTVAQALRPYPQYYSVEERFPYNTNSNYNSLQITATRRVARDLSFLAAYSWSKAIGYSDALGPAAAWLGTRPQDYFNRSLEKSVAGFNQPHNFKLTWVWETPFGKGRHFDLHWANLIAGGWQIAAIHNYATGFPIAVSQSGINVPAGFAEGIRPDVTGKPSALGGIPSRVDSTVPSPYLDPAAFAHSPTTSNGTPLRVGTAPRFLPDVRGPAQYAETIRASKRFYLWSEKAFFLIGATWSNALKRLTPYIIDTNISSSGFGKVLQSGGGRTLQLEARVEF